MQLYHSTESQQLFNINTTVTESARKIEKNLPLFVAQI